MTCGNRSRRPNPCLGQIGHGRARQPAQGAGHREYDIGRHTRMLEPVAAIGSGPPGRNLALAHDVAFPAAPDRTSLLNEGPEQFGDSWRGLEICPYSLRMV